MNNPSTLVLITAAFPYGRGETFIENEIQFLGSHFQKILIIPKTQNLHLEKRKLPENCKVIPLAALKTGKAIEPKIFISFFKLFLNEQFRNLINFDFKKIIWINEAARNVYAYINKLTTIFKQESIKSDETILYSYWMLSDALAIGLLKSKYKFFKAVARAHRYDLYEEETKRNFHPFKNSIVQNLDKIFPVSIHGANYLKERHKPFENKIKVGRLGVKGRKTQLENISQEFCILSCSGIRKVKRVHLIPKALSKLNLDSKINRSIKWVHIGGGEEVFENEITEITKFLPKNIQVELLGNKKNEEVINYYKNNKIDVFINVSSSEGLPVSIMEAQSFGIPVIATNVGGTAEIVDNENGILLNANPTVDKITNAIETFLSMDNSCFNAKQEKSFENWNSKFNASINYPNFIQELING